MPITPTETSMLDRPETTGRRRVLRRVVVVYLVLLGLLLLALVPPLINVNRFKHRIVTSISTTLGRPVHLDRVSLNVLPFPGFTLENFVVAEDPAFGSEPIIRANTVRVRLRIASLWRRKVEFSKISLDDPSLNLVHNSHGRWNFESILQQTSQIAAAPTGQLRAGAEPRFPYVEATGARINIKAGVEKLPFSLTDADLALWLPAPGQWNLRLKGQPSRTDTSASDTGKVSVEGTLGRAASFAQTPVDLKIVWQSVPLGEASMVVLGRDLGVRGELTVSLAVRGTAEDAAVKSRVQVSGLRRTAFVPAQAVDVDMECEAEAAKLFHAFHAIRCSWPPPNTTVSRFGLAIGGVDTARLLALTGEIGDVYDPATVTFQAGAPQLSAETALTWMRVLTTRLPAEETAAGVVTAKFEREAEDATGTKANEPKLAAGTSWDGELAVHGGSLSGAAVGAVPIRVGDVAIDSARSADDSFVLAPTTVALGGREPVVFDGRVGRTGYTLHMVGMATPERLKALARAVPEFGDGMGAVLPETAKDDVPVRLDVTITRVWGGGQKWVGAAAAKPATKSKRRGRR